jgi:hypothetical protein
VARKRTHPAQTGRHRIFMHAKARKKMHAEKNKESACSCSGGNTFSTTIAFFSPKEFKLSNIVGPEDKLFHPPHKSGRGLAWLSDEAIRQVCWPNSSSENSSNRLISSVTLCLASSFPARPTHHLIIPVTLHHKCPYPIKAALLQHPQAT